MTRQTTLLEDVISLPWPFGAIAAAVTFGIFQFLQHNPPDGISGQVVVTVARFFGWVIPGLFLLGAFISLLTQLVRSKRFKTTNSISDIRDRATLEKNFREQFEALNRVRLTESEFARLLDEVVTPDVFTASKTLPNALGRTESYD